MPRALRLACRRLLPTLALVLVAFPARADEAAIRARLDAWTRAFNARDKAAACELFSRNLISEYRGQGEAGYEDRCALIGKALDDPARRFRYSTDIKEIIVAGDLAVVRLTWRLTVTPGDVTSVEPGMDIFRKEDDGVWRIVRYIAYEE
ncbi:nuclear transport factor 2 family protein [Starkeya koreensis]|uniref:Nuclear transport factor 2 family protein n=1 Tax=Ancylobacter koreensis TaxID=266121 RepID=A0ABT0DRD1_9HYPH|nr:nuclear transport factor 2 family protein [Ancylobacter koreensis]MCK0209672.1 nuclear transport factor 2 family protein [Ancylobacter koreensis]